MSKKNLGIPLKGFAEYTKKAVHEGCVLLKNENTTLPLLDGESVALFGRCQIDFYRSGTGSGGAVNVAYTTNLLGGLRKLGRIKLYEELAKTYENWVNENPFDNGGGGWAAEPWHQAEMPVSGELAAAARSHAEKAVVVIGRTAGEDKDNADTEGAYCLTADELQMLKTVTAHFERVAVVLNVANIIDMSWMNDESFNGRITAVLYAWQGGVEGGNAVAEVLTQAAYPSGKLTDAIALAIADYPATKNFGDAKQNIYQEDIYVGYRYFETFAPERVMFPFGFGLSYTRFEITVYDAALTRGKDETIIMIPIMVKNIGGQSGKEVVQVYFEAPQGKLGRPLRELAVFKKTQELLPGAICEIALLFRVNDMAVYDDSGATGHPNCYVLEAGGYRIYVGNSVRDAAQITIGGKEAYQIAEDIVTLQCSEALAPTKSFTRMKPGARKQDGSYEIVYEDVPTRTAKLGERIAAHMPQIIPQTGDKGIKLKDVHSGKATLDEFIAQLDTAELATLVRGEGMGSDKASAAGTAAVFGGVSESLFKKGIPVGCCADGPSGIRMGAGLQATQMPIGTLLASTWNMPLVEMLYEMEGKELVSNDIDALLGPGINIHRHPLNGRNFEYFSEDPLLSGMAAAAVSRGLTQGGAFAVAKHFACNNQEAFRTDADSVLSQRAARQIYLRAFEIAVKHGGLRAIMTSYNPVNGHWAASNYDLNTTILRGEWGYSGMVMTDWWAKLNDTVTAGEADNKNLAAMVRAQNDIYMVVNNNGAEINSHGDNIPTALEDGSLTVGELQRCAKNICAFLLGSKALHREQTPYSDAQHFAPQSNQNAPAQVDENPVMMPEKGNASRVYARAGTYSLIVKLMSPLTNMSQSSCDILLNGTPLITVITNGTNGKWMIQKVKTLEFDDGWYEFEFIHKKAGMEFEWVMLKA